MSKSDSTLPEGPNPSGLCMCGCGQKTRIAKRGDKRWHAIKGRPQRFVKGHKNRDYPLRGPDYVIDETTGCWEWQKAANNGYGIKTCRRRGHRAQIYAHRFYFELHRGPIPDGMFLDHLCRNRRCVNPNHLEVVTTTENNRRGSMTRLTAEDASAIRKLGREGQTNRAIAAQFSIVPSMVSLICAGRRWKLEAE